MIFALTGISSTAITSKAASHGGWIAKSDFAQRVAALIPASHQPRRFSFVRSARTPSDIKRAYPSRRGARKRCALLTSQRRQTLLGTATNRLSTCEAGTARYSGPGR